MLLSNRWIDANEALAAGLVNRIVPRKDLMPAAEELAQRIASIPALAARAAKEAIVRGSDMSLAEGLELEKRLATLVLSSGETRERVKEFLRNRRGGPR
jgi:enoyl-CoA hydratase